MTLISHLTDAHCHPTETSNQPTDAEVEALPLTIVAMSSQLSDQKLVADLYLRAPDKVVPAFGHHPWFCHTIALSPDGGAALDKEAHYRSVFHPKPQQADAFARLLDNLPDPIPLTQVLETLRHNLERFPCAMLGEVGLDRAFRIPFSPISYDDPDPTDDKENPNGKRPRLSPFTTEFDHQLSILRAQLELAIELKRHVSLHSVRAPAATKDLLDSLYKVHKDKFWDISVDMHSAGISPDLWRQIERTHPNIFLSLSTAINNPDASHPLLSAVTDETRLLAESDFPRIEACGPRTWDMMCIMAQARGWRIEEESEEWSDTNRIEDAVNGHGDDWGAVQRLEANWKRFVRGGHRKRK